MELALTVLLWIGVGLVGLVALVALAVVVLSIALAVREAPHGDEARARSLKQQIDKYYSGK